MSVHSRPAGLLPAHASRYRPGAGTHVESWFLRANHATRPQALWLKATLSVPIVGQPVAEAWFVWFDRDAGQRRAGRATVPLGERELATDVLEIEVAGCHLRLQRDSGAGRGQLISGDGSLAWDLTWQAVPGALGTPMYVQSHPWLLEGPIPRSKTVTPLPALLVTGTVTVDGAACPIDRWVGSLGHNWGKDQPWALAWAQCVFPDADGTPHCFVEGFSAKLKMGPIFTPWISALIVRRGEREWRFDKLVDLWRQDSRIDDLGWVLRIRGGDGEALLTLRAQQSDIVCLSYPNPDGEQACCLNSKLASAQLRVNPTNDEGFTCTTEHGAALEFQRRDFDPRFPVDA